MIRIVKRKHCLWRNIYAPRPVFTGELALPEPAYIPPPAPLVKTLGEKLPGLEYAADMDAPRLVAALAQFFQLVGDVTPSLHGVHAFDGEKRTAKIFFGCMDPFLGEAALALAVQLVNALAKNPAPHQLAALLDRSMTYITGAALDQSSRAMIAEAERREIPWFRMSASGRFVQFGQGHRQRRIFETLRSADSPIGRDLSRSKLLTFQILQQLHLPVGRFAAFQTVDAALKAAEAIGYPVVLKPVHGSKGNFVFANLRNAAELRAVLASVAGQRRKFLLQSFFTGEDHRILIVDGKLVGAARRMAAFVTGDGKRTVIELVEEANCDPRRGAGFAKLMQFIQLDEEADRILQLQSHSRTSVPARDEHVRLRSIANISSGGSALDVTGIIHPDNARVAIKAAKALELTVAGVDFISPDISKSWREVGGGICEVNAVVGLRAHFLTGPETKVTGPIIETIYPNRQNGRIPTAMITGSKGKSTTTKMLHTMLTAAGHTAAAATTDGVVIGDEQVASGDYAGATGASIALRDPTVTAVALETARGGLLKSGMYLDWCNVAVLTCIAREQIEVDGINTIEDLAALKREVLDAARDAVVLNADDPFCVGMIPHFARMRTILYSKDASSPIVRTHTKAGGEAIVFNKGAVEIRQGSQSTHLIAVAEIASTMNGLIEINAVNAMAATGLALGLGLTLDHVREALKRYDTSLKHAAGRLTFVDGFPFKVMFDRAAQAPAFESVIPVLKKLGVAGKRICLCSHAGNRPYWSTREGAQVLAGNFDHYVCYDRVPYRRGKGPGEIASTIAAALKEFGVAPANISVADTTESAAQTLAGLAKPDDFAVVFCADAHGFIEKFRAAFDAASK